MSGLVKPWWFLETAGLGQELRKQVVIASGGSYRYERLREALMAIVPRVQKEDELPQVLQPTPPPKPGSTCSARELSLQMVLPQKPYFK